MMVTMMQMASNNQLAIRNSQLASHNSQSSSKKIIAVACRKQPLKSAATG